MSLKNTYIFLRLHSAQACGVVMRLAVPLLLDLVPSEESVDCLRGVTPWTARRQYISKAVGPLYRSTHRYGTCRPGWGWGWTVPCPRCLCRMYSSIDQRWSSGLSRDI